MYTHLTQKSSPDVVSVLADSWDQRVAVRNRGIDLSDYYASELPDFPPTLVPFCDDERFTRLPVEVRRRILAGAWLAYNEKTIGVEISVVAPTCELLATGAFPGMNSVGFRRVVSQTQVDEQYHILMCLEACLVARQHHRLEELRFPTPTVITNLERRLEQAENDRSRALIRLAYTTVAETTINAYLNLVADAPDIQPMNREITALHRRDESSHNKLFREIAKRTYFDISVDERAQFSRALGWALDDFVEIDLGAWGGILEYIGVDETEGILATCAENCRGKRAFRDYSGFKNLLRDLEISESQIQFDFGDN